MTIKPHLYTRNRRITLFYLLQQYAVLGEAPVQDWDEDEQRIHEAKMADLEHVILEDYKIRADDVLIDNELEPVGLRGPQYNR